MISWIGNVTDPIALMWYRNLTIDKRIMVKELCKDALGVDFHTLRVIFSLGEIITIFHDKLWQAGAFGDTTTDKEA